MSLHIQIARRREFQSKVLWDMHKLRAKVFKERMGWEVPIMSGMEIDGYDAIEPYYMVIREVGGTLRGCMRLLPTEGPYMLKDTFPELLNGVAAPEDAKIWELSRFAMETEGRQNFGFSEVAMAFVREIIAHGHREEIGLYVAVTTTSVERLLRRAGVCVTRFGPPIRIGVENAVALYVDIDKSYKAMFDGVTKAA